MKTKENYEEILNHCLIRVIDEGASLQEIQCEYPDFADELAADIETARFLTHIDDAFNPRPGFLSASRKFVLSQLELSFPGGVLDSFANQIRFGILPRIVTIMVILLAVFFGGGMIALASMDALPGGGLYPARRATESIRLLLVMDEQKEAGIHLELAQAYLVDYAVLTSQRDWKGAAIVLKQYDRHISSAGRTILEMSGSKVENFDALIQSFSRTYLQDLEIFKLLSTGSF